jgi:hypothetical protein
MFNSVRMQMGSEQADWASFGSACDGNRVTLLRALRDQNYYLQVLSSKFCPTLASRLLHTVTEGSSETPI